MNDYLLLKRGSALWSCLIIKLQVGIYENNAISRVYGKQTRTTCTPACRLQI
jgi:hypothetical protein